MKEQEIRENISIFMMLLRASQDQSTHFKDNVSRQSKMLLNNYFNQSDRLMKSLVNGSINEVDETLEDGAEYYLTGVQLLHKALKGEKAKEAIEVLERLTES